MQIALLGYGRMGQAIERLAQARGHRIVCRIKRENAHILSPQLLKQADVAIDFSLPHTAFHHIQAALDAGIPTVSGTTGWTERLPEIQAYCQSKGGAFIYASNFSIGVNLFFRINEALARLMDGQPQYEVSLEEIHHIHKLDSPSGTAITLAEQIVQALSRKTSWRETATPQKEELSIEAYRKDMVPGTHTVHYQSEIDTITIKHEAHSRDGFALGAILAAEWLQGQQGVFGMADVLGR